MCSRSRYRSLGEVNAIDYSCYVELVGTAHFTKRSIKEAMSKIMVEKPSDVALELDLERFRELNSCSACPKRFTCNRSTCEFTAASDALGNMDANLWLIDMDRQEIKHRLAQFFTPAEAANLSLLRGDPREGERMVELWELGYKDLAMEVSERQWQLIKRYLPSFYRVILLERDALMAARLVWIVDRKLERSEQPKILAFVGASHLEGIRYYLSNPQVIAPALRRFNLPFTPPTLVRRVKVAAR